jgi:23S rRNA (uridine2552-2'-O)-methyltransferase
MEIIKGVKFLKLDFLEEKNKKKIIEAIDTKADIVLSDMAADTTGNKNLDCIRTNLLCAEVIEFARFVLKDTGVVVSKLFNGTDFIKVKNLAKKNFKKVNFFKPKSSKDASKETYIHCEGIKTL